MGFWGSLDWLVCQYELVGECKRVKYGVSTPWFHIPQECIIAGNEGWLVASLGLGVVDKPNGHLVWSILYRSLCIVVTKYRFWLRRQTQNKPYFIPYASDDPIALLVRTGQAYQNRSQSDPMRGSDGNYQFIPSLFQMRYRCEENNMDHRCPNRSLVQVWVLFPSRVSSSIALGLWYIHRLPLLFKSLFVCTTYWCIAGHLDVLHTDQGNQT